MLLSRKPVFVNVMFQIFVFVIICLKVLDILKSFSSVFLAADKDSDAKYLLGGSIYNDSKGVKKTRVPV